jgi:hypothetical protein
MGQKSFAVFAAISQKGKLEAVTVPSTTGYFNMGRPPKKYHFSTTHQYDHFEIGVSDWEIIEWHSDYKISETARSKILACTRHFLSMAEAERNARQLYKPSSHSNKGPKRSDAENRLRKIELHATNLRNTLNEIKDYASDNPALSADDLIGMNCDRPELGGKAMPPKARFCGRRLANILNDFVAACDAASRELKLFERAELFKQGDAWKGLVVGIADVIASEDLPVSTAIYCGYRNKSELPKFVRLIQALHNHIPTELVPPHRTDAALAKAIGRAIQQKAQDS